MSEPFPSQYTEYRDDHVLICGRISFDIVVGDIALSQRDTLINSTDDDVDLSVSVAKALANKAGDAYRAACKGLIPLAPGTVKETGAYNMPCKQILHCNVPYWKKSKDPQELKKVFIKCLEMSAQKGYKSVGTPTIGMGVKRYPAEVVALALPQATAEYAEKNPGSSIKQVKLYLYQREITAAEKQIFKLTLLQLGGKSTPNGQELLNGKIFEVFTGDLAETKADAIVNSTGNNMSLSGGNVASALLRKAGQPLQDECKNLAPIKDGDIAVTNGHGLPCDNVIHACTPSWKADKSKKELKELITKCLKAADDLGAETVAFAALGTGLLGYSPETVARSLFEASADFSANNPNGFLKIIKVVIYAENESTKDGFERALRRKIAPYVETKENKKPLSPGLEKLLSDLPSNWENPLYEYQEVKVTEGSKEWTDCITTFKKTLSNPNGWTFIEVRRVQNPDSYQLYSHLRASVARKLRKQEDEVEKTLWHGTKQQTVPFITRSRFDRGLSGSATGTWYGLGSYFATTSQYSTGYCTPNNAGEKFMIMAKVITGDYIKGDSEMKTAPYKEGSKLEQYDSVVDDVTNPSMYVVFHDASAYPEYIIKFRRGQPPRPPVTTTTTTVSTSDDESCAIL